jgi:hypothetical protein
MIRNYLKVTLRTVVRYNGDLPGFPGSLCESPEKPPLRIVDSGTGLSVQMTAEEGDRFSP